MQIRTKAHIAVLFTNIFFAINFSMVKMLSPALVKPFAMNLLRVGLSLVLFWGAWLFSGTKAGIRKEDWPRFFWCALSGVAVNQMLFIKGLTLTTTIHASLLMLATPILVTIFAFWVLGEKFTFFKAAGIALGVGGSVLLIMQKEAGHQASNYLLGDILILLNAIAYSVYFILVKPLMHKYSPLHVIRWVFTLGLVMMLPFGWTQFTEINWQAFNWQHTAAMANVVICGTFLAYFFNAYGIRHIGAGPAGAYIYTQPVFAGLIAILLLGEAFTWEKGAAGLLIFLGVWLVNRKN